jgi:cyanophycinase-like exopeptidase
MVQPQGNILLTRMETDSYRAISTGVVPLWPNAGFKLFQFNSGLIDVHFSERWRQGRLYQLAINTKKRFAFGIDEDSGIVEKDNIIEFVGSKGTVTYDMIHQDRDNGIYHYLTLGDKIDLNGVVTFPEWLN